MKKQNRILAMLLALMMTAMPMFAFAAEEGVEASDPAVVLDEEAAPAEAEEPAPAEEEAAAEETAEAVPETVEAVEEVTEEEPAAEGEEVVSESSAWTEDDFTFDGATVTGFSETGLAKLESNADVVLPSKNGDTVVTTIGTGFMRNTSIKSIVMPDSITTISSGAFTQCTALSAVTFSANLTEIPQAAFNTCDLREVVLPEGITSLGRSALAGNLNLTKLTLPETLTTIANNAVENHQLTELVIPAAVKSVGNYAFRVNNEKLTNSLTSLTLNEGLETIGKAAFGRSSLTEVTLPTTVTKIDKTTFKDSTSVVKVYTDNADLVASDNPAQQLDIILSPREITFDYNGGSGEVTSAQTDDNGKIAELPAATRLGYDFEGWFTAAEEGSAVTADTVFSESTTVYAQYSTDWEEGDFTFDGATVTGFSETGLARLAENADVVLPSKNGDTDVTTIGTGFMRNTSIKSIVMPDSITTISAGAFTQCTALSAVTFSANLTEIPQAAFNTCDLREVALPEGITSIGRMAFAGNLNLTKLTLPETLTTIGRQAVENHQLTELVIPAAVKSIENYAFRVNNENLTNSLTSLTLNEGLETIGKAAFGRSNLTKVTLPTTVTKIDKTAFKDSTSVVNAYTDNPDLLVSDNPEEQLHIVLLPRDITFDFNDGTGRTTVLQTGDKGTLEALPEAEADFLVFDGWFADGSETAATVEDFYPADTTLTAKWIETAAAPKITSIGSNAQAQVEVVWDEVEGAEGYVTVYRKAGDTEWSEATVDGTSAIVKKLKSKGLYEFKTASVSTIKGELVQGKWSNISRRYLSKGVIRSVTAGKKKVTVKWKKDTTATGYMIKYGYKKDLSDGKFITVNGKSKVKYTIKGLKKGKRVYVRVRPIKKYGGQQYLGVLSSLKSAKVK